jgi:hypothetical protein
MNDIEKLRAVIPSGQSLGESGDLAGTCFGKMTRLRGANKPGNACFRSATYCLSLAERVGFEPTVEETPTHALQACLLDHSSTSPRRGWDSNPRSELIGDRFSRAAP